MELQNRQRLARLTAPSATTRSKSSPRGYGSGHLKRVQPSLSAEVVDAPSPFQKPTIVVGVYRGLLALIRIGKMIAAEA
jgi:hypothetical protein